jgi:hypothetical protein
VCGTPFLMVLELWKESVRVSPGRAVLGVWRGFMVSARRVRMGVANGEGLVWKLSELWPVSEVWVELEDTMLRQEMMLNS